MPPYLPCEFTQISVGRRSSARTPSTGDTSGGADTFSVVPSAAAVSALGTPTNAEGAVIGCGVELQATPAINKARHEPTRKNFIKQISRCGRQNAVRVQRAGNSCTHMAGRIVSEFHTRWEVGLNL